MTTSRLPAGSVRAVLGHPALWWVAVRQSVRLAGRGWWHRPPFLPVPDADYLRFRMVAAYGGDGDRDPEAADLITYLRWCRAWPRVSRRESSGRSAPLTFPASAAPVQPTDRPRPAEPSER